MRIGIRQASKSRMRHSPPFVSRERNFTATGTTRYCQKCRVPSEMQNWKCYFASLPFMRGGEDARLHRRFSGKRVTSHGEGRSPLDFPLIHDMQAQNKP